MNKKQVDDYLKNNPFFSPEEVWKEIEEDSHTPVSAPREKNKWVWRAASFTGGVVFGLLAARLKSEDKKSIYRPNHISLLGN